LLYDLIIKRAAEAALIIPPINESTVDIFWTYLTYVIELEDFTNLMYAYNPPYCPSSDT
jgi:hypothetical protein